MITNVLNFINMVLLVRFCVLGIYGTLALYHFTIWLGRRHDLSNLAFSIVSFALFAYMLIGVVIPQVQLQIIANHVFVIIMAGSLPLFYYTLGQMPAEVKSFHLKGSAVLIGLGCLSLFHYYWTGTAEISAGIYSTCALVFVVPSTGLGGFYYVKKKIYKQNEQKFFYTAFLCLTVFWTVSLIYFGFLEHSDTVQLNYLLIFNLPFLVLLGVVAVTLARKFNREYRELLELKTTLEKKVEQRTEELREANQQKTQFFVNLAHETKTPLTLISNFADEYIAHHDPSMELMILRHSIEKLQTDMVNFLDLEKLERGQLFYNHELVTDLSAQTRLQAELYKPLTEKHGIECQVTVQSGLCVHIDPTAFDRILNNLIDNAIKYSTKPGVLKISLAAKDGKAVLNVQDKGPGIPPEHQEVIFQPYHQLSHFKRSTQGIGMGLAIVKKIVDDAGGSLQIKSAPGNGTIFSIAFQQLTTQLQGSRPLSSQVSQLLNTPLGIELLKEEYHEKRPSILIVEDNIALVYLLQKRLGKAFNVFYAHDGEQALEKLPHLPRIHVIVSDIMMQPMDGFTFYDRIADDSQYASIPFIFLTALTAHSDRLKGLRKGAVDYMDKPFHIDVLLEKLKSLIKIQAALSLGNLKKIGHTFYSHINAQSAEAVGTSLEEQSEEQPDVNDPQEKMRITKRQLEIIALLKVGLERKEICYKLGFSMNTMRTQMRRLFEKCGVYNKTELLNIFNSV